jgi:hypothetical protein
MLLLIVAKYARRVQQRSGANVDDGAAPDLPLQDLVGAQASPPSGAMMTLRPPRRCHLRVEAASNS